jgi:hypothetical protein
VKITTKIKIKELLYFLSLFIFINFLAALDYFVYLPRSIFYYEYIVVLFAIIYFRNLSFAYFLFCLIFILDIFDIISNIYLFDISELFSSLKFIFLFKFNFQHYLILFSVSLYFILTFHIFKYFKKKIQPNKSIFIKYIIIFYFIVIILDVCNGSSKLVETNDLRKITQKNISSLLLKNYFDQITQLYKNPVKVVNYKSPSITFESFKNDSTGNQLLILVESWGLINDSIIQEALQSNINKHINNKKYFFKWGKTNFSGSTASGELKELLSLKGNYKYFLHHRSDTNSIKSIFDYKNKQGYTTYGFHCYSENMFNRSVWWKNIGIKNEYFKENYVKENLNKKIIIDDDGPFASITDVDMFNFMQLKIQNKNKKSFSYFLTENSHLPFKKVVNDNYPTQNLNFNALPLSEEAKNQLKYIKNLLTIILQNLDTNKWQKVLIMGDHNPPYLNKNDRNFYSGKMVPYVLIYK